MSDQRDPYLLECPSRDILNRIGDKWSVLVLGRLSDGEPHRFARIRDSVGGVSEKMLTQTLRHLEEDGLVSRRIFPEVPPRVEYSLTALGYTLRGPLIALREWSTAHTEDVLAARDRFSRQE